ncbi:hypothetical protein O6H91_11G065800 [Diphasiastrum complanatum]|uniref:Uncharacterized protein n=1 Tax=Diphasiastrum complanatum TaxID=34168 RepID=A0ACC2C9Y9_DIPCM|nr:hypothetical protein O6H91_11G065800 [Diphasiastrum complanatum]
MAMDDALSVMHFLDCPVCWESFSSRTHIPRILGCGHTVCEHCLKQLFFDTGPAEQCFICPECRSLTRRREIQDMPKNYTVLHALKGATYRTLEEHVRERFFKLWQEVPAIFTSATLRPVTTWVPRLLKHKLLEVGNMLGSSVVLTLLLPISYVHMCVSWIFAGISFIVFCCSYLGGIVLGSVMLFIWWIHNLAILVEKFVRFLNRVHLCYQKGY